MASLPSAAAAPTRIVWPSPLRTASGHLPVASKCLASAIGRRCVFSGSAVDCNPRVCGLELWISRKLKHQKNIKTHGWAMKIKKLEVHGKDELEIESSSSSSERKPIDDAQLLRDLIEETTSSKSPSTECPSSSEQPVMHKDLEYPKGSSSAVLETSSFSYDHLVDRVPSLCIAVVGATGELARNKVFPALFALYYSGFLPENVGIFGYSRKQLTDEDLRSIIAATLTCRVDHQLWHNNKADLGVTGLENGNSLSAGKDKLRAFDTL